MSDQLEPLTDRVKPLQRHRADGAELSQPQRWRRSNATIDKSGLLPALERVLNSRTGRPRIFTARAFLVCLLMNALDKRDMLITQIALTAKDLTPSQLHTLGLPSTPTYNQIWDAFSKITRAFENETITADDGSKLTIDTYVDMMLEGSIPAMYERTSCVAVDGTDYETWAKVKSGRTPAPGETLIPDKDFPWTGPDKRKRHTLDADALIGHRSSQNLRQTVFYAGSEIHAAVQIAERKGNEVPHLIVGITVTPASSSFRADGAIRTIDAIRKNGHTVDDLCIDRGYTQLDVANFMLPMWQRRITVWADLKTNQTGQHPGPVAGTVWVDGTLYISDLPDKLRSIAPPSMTATAKEKAAIRLKFDKRKPYAFVAHGPRNADGYQRLRGPAIVNHVRCANNPASDRLPIAAIETSCVGGQPCPCGTTLTIAPTVFPTQRQNKAWGSTEWAANYCRRVGVESANAALKVHELHLRRGYTRIFGLIKTAVLLSASFAAFNIRTLAAWHAKRGLADPWGTTLGEPAPPPLPKTRRRRRTETYNDVLGPPEGGGPDTLEAAS